MKVAGPFNWKQPTASHPSLDASSPFPKSRRGGVVFSGSNPQSPWERCLCRSPGLQYQQVFHSHSLEDGKIVRAHMGIPRKGHRNYLWGIGYTRGGWVSNIALALISPKCKPYFCVFRTSPGLRYRTQYAHTAHTHLLYSYGLRLARSVSQSLRYCCKKSAFRLLKCHVKVKVAFQCPAAISSKKCAGSSKKY